MRTASHCLWLGKNPGGSVNRKGPSPLSTSPGALSRLHLEAFLASPCQPCRVSSTHHHCARSKRSPKGPTLHQPHQLWDSGIFCHKVRIRSLRLKSHSASLQRNVPGVWPPQR